MQTIQNFLNTFFINLTPKKSDQELLKHLNQLNAVRKAVFFGCEKADRDRFFKPFQQAGCYRYTRPIQQELFSVKKPFPGEFTVITYEQGLRGFFCWFPKIHLGFFAWLGLNEPIFIPPDFFENIRDRQWGNSDNDWTKLLTAAGGFYADSSDYKDRVKKTFDTLFELYAQTKVLKSISSRSQAEVAVTQLFLSEDPEISVYDNRSVQEYGFDMGRMIARSSTVFLRQVVMSKHGRLLGRLDIRNLDGKGSAEYNLRYLNPEQFVVPDSVDTKEISQ